MTRLYERLAPCRKEEEVKAEFCKFFRMKIFALRGIDHYTEQVLFEFKYDRNFRAPENVARALAQTMYYARMLKFGAGLTRYPLPPVICVVDKNEAFFAETRDYARFYADGSARRDGGIAPYQTGRYDWDRAPSTPCPKLVADILDSFGRAVAPRPPDGEDCGGRGAPALPDADRDARPARPSIPYVYDLTNPAEEEQFVAALKKHLTAQMTFLDLLEKKAINEDNFLDVFDYWDALFGAYVRNGRKSSEYFLADIEQGKSLVAQDGRVLFSVSGAYIPKTLQPDKYRHFWQNYEKVPPPGMTRIRQKADRLTEDFRRRFTGEFYTPVEFAAKGLDYLERTIGREWWKSGEYRFWDMAAGTGNLEFSLPSSALPYCYLSTLEAEDARYCQKIFPAATCFQYDYLADDIPALAGQMTFGQRLKMPPNLAADLANPKLKWIVFINPPFATANTVGSETGKKSKDTVSMTTLREWMTQEGYGEASRELFTQFLFRISKEFKNRQTHLCLFSKLKYLNSNNDQKIRDGFFQYQYERGFIFPIKCFYGAKGNFPVGFLVWNLAKRKHLSRQRINIDVFNSDVEKIGVKTMPSVSRDMMLNKWCPRPKWDGKSIMPTFVSAFNQMEENKDQRNHIAPGFLCSMSSKGDDMQHQNSVFILSAPYANAGAFSVTPENFERAMVLHAVKKIPKATWTNDRDAFYAPTAAGAGRPPYRDASDTNAGRAVAPRPPDASPDTDAGRAVAPRPSDASPDTDAGRAVAPRPPDAPTGLPAEFVTDCVVWSAFADSNNCVALRNVEYQGRTWQIANNLFPFLLEEVRTWPCAHGDIAAQLAAANEDRFLAKWLASAGAGRPPYRDASDANAGRAVAPRPPDASPDTDAGRAVAPRPPDASPDTDAGRAVAPRPPLSPESLAVMDAARRLYRAFYANITRTPWMDWKIETWDVGYYQVRNAMKGVDGGRGAPALPGDESGGRAGRAPLPALRAAHDALRAKLLPQVYALGFLNPDVEYFT